MTVMGAVNVVYTAIVGRYDVLKPHPLVRGVRFVAFLDDCQRREVEGWEVRSLLSCSDDPVRCARRYKVLAHEVLPEADYSLWVDGSVQIRDGFDWDAVVGTYLESHDLAMYRHYCRSCAYAEAEVCAQLGLDARETIARQVRRYETEGYPRDCGLVETGIIFRRHTPVVEGVNVAWWREICSGSRRDQLSFNYVLWKLGVGYRELPGDVRTNAFFELRPHQVGRFPVPLSPV